MGSLKPRYRLHWASGHAPNPALKWAIYDWGLRCAVAYAETRTMGRRLCAFLNTHGTMSYEELRAREHR